jgi:hypothetical protein
MSPNRYAPKPYHFKCNHCGNEWDSTIEHPKVCPKCHKYSWNAPPKIKPQTRCAYCGEIITRPLRPSTIAKSKHKQFFCNQEHRGKYMSLHAPPSLQIHCDYCGKLIERHISPSLVKEHNFCCCSHQAKYRNKDIVPQHINCSYCGKLITRRIQPSKMGEHNFCGDDCNYKFKTKLMPELYCAYCNVLITRHLTPRELAQNNHFCCHKHNNLFKKGKPHYWGTWNKGLNHFIDSRCIGGDKHHLWKGGLSFQPYSPAFNKYLKQQIKERDNYTCQLCFHHKDDGIILAIHHIDFDKQNCDPDNLITLCHKCNLKVNNHRDWWTVHFQIIIKTHRRINREIRKRQKEYNRLYLKESNIKKQKQH